MTWLMATLGPKGQLTLPKKVRLALGVETKGDTVGFALDEKTHSVRLAKMEVKPASEDYSEKELQKLLKIAKSKKGKSFSLAHAFIRHLEKL